MKASKAPKEVDEEQKKKSEKKKVVERNEAQQKFVSKYGAISSNTAAKVNLYFSLILSDSVYSTSPSY